MSTVTIDNPEAVCTTKRRLAPDSLAASVAILLVVSVVQRSVGFGRGVLFCRWLEPDELGQWDMAYSFLLLAAPLVVLGLPGCFGRYLERFRQRGQLRTFLHRTATWTAALSATAIGVMVWAWPTMSGIVFGRPDQKTLVWWMCAALTAVILHHFLEALFAALRKFRIVSAMQMCQSFTFAAISLSLLWWWRLAAESIIIGYGAACLFSVAATLLVTGRSIAEEAAAGESVPHAEFWPPLVRFAIWIWFTNLLCNMFAVVDRYMLVHYSGLDSITALEQVGNYHSSRVVPVLLISLADLLAGIVMPYLSHDWERGEKRLVSDRINLVLKLTALGMLGVSVVVLWAAPLLFQIAFEGKYADGLAVLPWTLTYCVWYALLIVAQNYIWCAEKTKIGSMPLGVGLVANILLNLVLLPVWGLHGAVVATTFSTGFALGLLYWLNHREGMELQPGLLWLTAAPIALGGGPWLASAALVLLVVAAPFSRMLFNDRERGQLSEFLLHQVEIVAKQFAKQRKSAVSG